ncbi:DNA replication complex GINS family protein [Candidatus Pacearchaeota archaeon]|nr:DNA replication complex GINS family protein [Candidatus Pacearchaeota archaeon]
MITYNDLYEALRKERYSEQLQPLIKDFVKEVSSYIKEKENVIGIGGGNGSANGLFSDETVKTKKQLENAISIFKELILRRKKKLLDLAFVSAETGISKRDFDNMLGFEKEMFEKIMKAVNEGDKILEQLLNGGEEGNNNLPKNKLVMFKQDTDEFLDLEGNKLGPFKKGDIVNIPQEIANILIVDSKADPIEDN